ncbi:MAG: hypothetical protein RR905_03050 [Aurantimicrobium sp.]
MISTTNVTQFYWGQERLLNILPALFSIVSDPGTNLYLILITAAISHFLLLLIITSISVSAVGGNYKSWYASLIFVITSAAFLFTFADYAIFEMAVYHFEWPLAIDLSALAVFLYLSRLRFWIRIPLVVLIAGLAVGLNFSIAVILAALIIFLTLVKKLSWKDFLIWVSVGAIVMTYWVVVSGDLRSKNFKNFAWENFNTLIGTSIGRIFSAFDPLKSTIFITLIFAIVLILLVTRTPQIENSIHSLTALPFQMIAMGIAFCSAWILVFAQNDWVVINSNHFRYFAPIFYFFILVFTLFISLIVVPLGLGIVTTMATVTAGLILAFVTGWLGQTLDLKQANVVKQAHELAPEYSKYVAGDFWLAWPYSFGQLLDHKPSVSLALRSEQNRASTSEQLRADLAKDGSIQITCLGESTDACIQQVQWHLGLDTPPEVSDRSVDNLIVIKAP